MFKRLGTQIARPQIRLNSTTKIVNTIPKQVEVFPKLSDISAEEVFGSTPFGGAHRQYFIKRSQYGHLPVYKTIKSKAAYTEIRKVTGNVIQLRTDLIKLLPDIPAKEFKIVQQSNKILLRGDYVDVIKNVLETKF